MPRLDPPRPPGDRTRRVDDDEVDLGKLGDTIEQRGPIRRRLGEDRGDTDRRICRLREPLEPRRRLAPARFAFDGRAPCDVRPRSPRSPGRAGRRGRESVPARVPMRRAPGRASARAADSRTPPSPPNACTSSTKASAAASTSPADRLPRPYAPGELGALRVELGRDRRDLAQRNLLLELPLEVSSAVRRLSGVNAVEQQRLPQVVPVGVSKQPRPEVVVLALEIRRVVPKSVPVEQLAVDEHARVVEGRAEEGRPPDRVTPGRQEGDSTGTAGSVELEDRGSENPDPRVVPDALELALETPRHRDVVGVEPRDVARARLVQPSIQGRRKAMSFLVPEHPQARVGDLLEDRRCRVGRAVVDHEQLEVGDRLPEDALERRREVALAVRDGEEDGHERSGGHGRPVAYGACRAPFRRSTSSSRRSAARSRSRGCSSRFGRRPIARCE